MSVLFNKANLTDKSLNLTNFNRMVDYLGRLANMTSPNILIDRNPNGYVLKALPSTGGGTGDINMENIDFGYSITSTTSRTASFNPGVFRFSQQHFTVAGASGVVVNMSPAYIYLEYQRGGVPVLMPPTGDLNATIPDTDSYRHLFYTFTISSTGGLEISSIHHLGAVFVGAYWA